MPPEVEAKYHACITKLAGMAAPTEEGKIPLLQLSEEARALHKDFRARLEPRLKGDLADMKEWANKLAGGVGRIASIMHIAENGVSPVSAEAMRGALVIGETYLLAHARHALGVVATTGPQADSDAIYAWLRRAKIKRFTLRDAKQKGPRSLRYEKARLDTGLKDLVDRGCISVVGENVWSVAVGNNI